MRKNTVKVLFFYRRQSQLENPFHRPGASAPPSCACSSRGSCHVWEQTTFSSSPSGNRTGCVCEGNPDMQAWVCLDSGWCLSQSSASGGQVLQWEKIIFYLVYYLFATFHSNKNVDHALISQYCHSLTTNNLHLSSFLPTCFFWYNVHFMLLCIVCHSNNV